MESFWAVADYIMVWVDRVVDFIVDLSGHGILGPLIFGLGLVTLLLLLYNFAQKHHFSFLLYASLGFMPAAFALMSIGTWNNFPGTVLVHVYFVLVLLSIPVIKIQIDSYKAYKEKAPPPYGGTIVTLGLLSLIIYSVLIYALTEINAPAEIIRFVVDFIRLVF